MITTLLNSPLEQGWHPNLKVRWGGGQCIRSGGRGQYSINTKTKVGVHDPPTPSFYGGGAPALEPSCIHHCSRFTPGLMLHRRTFVRAGGGGWGWEKAFNTSPADTIALTYLYPHSRPMTTHWRRCHWTPSRRGTCRATSGGRSWKN